MRCSTVSQVLSGISRRIATPWRPPRLNLTRHTALFRALLTTNLGQSVGVLYYPVRVPRDVSSSLARIPTLMIRSNSSSLVHNPRCRPTAECLRSRRLTFGRLAVAFYKRLRIHLCKAPFLLEVCVIRHKLIVPNSVTEDVGDTNLDTIALSIYVFRANNSTGYVCYL
jgi:hypothetical protein